jgi:hypothetical protein
MNTACAEITETSLTSWNAGSWHWNKLPDFGSFVWTERDNKKIFAVVVASSIASTDSSRITMLYQKTEQELLRDQPQLMHFIRSSFTCAIVAFEESGKWYYQLPTAPPQLHSFVHTATPAQLVNLTATSHYLNVLAKTIPAQIESEEVWVAIASHLAAHKLLSRASATNFIQHAWEKAEGNYQSVRRFSQRIEQIL